MRETASFEDDGWSGESTLCGKGKEGRNSVGEILEGAVVLGLSTSRGGKGKTASGGAKGMANPKVAAALKNGKAAHEAFSEMADAKGWETNVPMTDPKTGKTVYADAVTPSGKPVELKPNTPSGKAKGAKQLPQYERATGEKGRVIYYDPTKLWNQ